MEKLQQHDYFLPKEGTYHNDGGWFISNGARVVDAFKLTSLSIDGVPDLRMYRQLLAYELSIATHPAFFWYEYSGDSPEPTERDREAMAAHLKFIASFTGILHADEIRQIESGDFYEFMRVFPRPEIQDPLPTRDELKQKIIGWKEEGYTIVAFQGSFDPPTETHLTNATDAMLFSQEQGLKFKIIFILDGDDLIQRKAESGDARPRVSINERREMLESFWQVAGTCVSKVKSTEDWWGYVLEYHELGIDHVLFTEKHNPGLQDIFELHKRNAVVRGAKKKVIWLEEVPNGLTSTELMRRHKD
jgi:hypothetical protein